MKIDAQNLRVQKRHIFIFIIQFVKKQNQGDTKKIDWLDKMTYEYIDEYRDKFFKETEDYWLYLELPTPDFPIFYYEEVFKIIKFQPDNSFHSKLIPSATNLILIPDLEIYRENPIEAKHRLLVRSHRSAALVKDLKPNAKERDELRVNIII